MEPWSSGLELGVPEMDEAHRSLDQQINLALEEAEKGNPPGVIAALTSFVAGLQPHFAWEEGKMVECAYREAGAHTEAHAAYLRELAGVIAEFPAAGLSPRFRLWFGARLVPWLRLHIRGIDAQFARHYRAWLEKQARGAEAALIADAKAVAPTAEAGAPQAPAKAGH
jgi:hemerythrin-like metal-binding protein